MKFSAQVQQVPLDAHPILMTVHGWSAALLFLLMLYGMGYSLTRYKKRDNSRSPLIKNSHPSG